MINAIAILAVFALMGVVFHELFVRLNVLTDVRGVLNVAPAAVRTIRSDTLTDLEKERAVRRMSLEVLKDTLRFTAKFALVLLACVGIAALAQSLFTLSPDGLYGLLGTWWAILALVAVMPLYARLKRARGGGTSAGPPAARADVAGRVDGADSENLGGEAASGSDAHAGADRYGPLDRLLHRVAFVHPALQRVLGDVENDLFRRQLAEVRVERPVFVTGLPRAGTTLLLELLHGTGEFASYTYRQMPFVLAPLLWNRVSARSQQAAVARERAHGDAMSVDFDSPEAFEEVLWINRLADTVFDGETMRTLGPDDLDAPFREAWRELAAKLVSLRASHGDPSSEAKASGHAAVRGPLPRYLSKNNANVARLPAIASVFPDATVLCCFREPAAHVASLHAQHLRFLGMHDRDAFAERYMAWIGHHDFGRNFRPIRFAGPIDVPATEAEFWLRYWIDGYRHALASAPASTRFVGFDDLLAGGADALATLADELGLAEPAALVDAAATLRAPTSVPESLESISPTLAAEADALYAALRARAKSGAEGRIPGAAEPASAAASATAPERDAAVDAAVSEA